MKIVLCGVGSRGDIQPLLGLARALVARGHDVARAGLRFHSMGTSMEELVQQHGEQVFNPIKFVELARDLAAEQLQHVLAAANGADVVVGGAACFTGPSVAAITGARFHWATFAPGSFPTSSAPFLLAGVGPSRRWLNALSHIVGNTVLARVLTKVLNPLRKQHGLKAVDSYEDAVYGSAALYAVDAAVDVMPGDWRVQAHQTGFWFYDDGSAFDAAVDAFLDDGDAPVYVGFGSMPVKDPAARTRAIVDGLQRAGKRGLISSGWAGLGDVVLPKSIQRVGPLSHARLFPRCAAVVHHCGAGTTAAAARAGVPQVPVPHAFDQPTWARRLRELGVASAPLPRAFDGGALASALAVVDDRGVRATAKALGDVISANDGAGAAADVIERLR